MHGIFDNAQTVFLCELIHASHVTGQSSEVKRDDGAGFFIYKLGGFFTIDAQVVIAYIAHDDFRASHSNCLVVGDVVERRRDDLVSGADTGDSQRHVQGRCAGIRRHDKLSIETEVFSDSFLKLFCGCTHAQPSDVQRVGQVFDRVGANVWVEYRNPFHPTNPSRA